MSSDRNRDESREYERDEPYGSLAAHRARRNAETGEEEYVDWSQTRRLGSHKSGKRSNVLAFGAPFVLVSAGLLWFSLHGRDNSLVRYAQHNETGRVRETIEKSDSTTVTYNANNTDETDDGADDAQREEGADDTQRAEGAATEEAENTPSVPWGYRVVSHKKQLLDENATESEANVDSDIDGSADAASEPTQETGRQAEEPERKYNLPTFDNMPSKRTKRAKRSQADAPTQESDESESGEILFDDNSHETQGDGEPVDEVFDETSSPDLETSDPLNDEPGQSELISAFDPLVAVFNADPEPTQESSQETEITEPEPPTGPSEEELAAARAQISQLEFTLEKVKERDLRDPDEAIEAIDPILEEAEALLASAPEETREEAQRAVDAARSFSDFFTNNAEFLRRLQTLDDAVMTDESARAFFAPYLEPNAAPSATVAPEIAQYERELIKVAQTLDPLRAIETWNAFIEENGERLEKYHVDRQTAQTALNFITENEANDAIPPEFAILVKRRNEWEYDVKRNTATQRKIFLALDRAASQERWTYAPSTELFYYLTAPAKPGVNVYAKDEHGTPGYVRIPAEAKEVGLAESPQKQLLTKLAQKTRDIPDELRDEDPAKWYALWCEVLAELHESQELDPILQYRLLKEIATILSSSDYQFDSRLAQIRKVLNAPQLAENRKINLFNAEDPDLKSLRNFAATRLRFVPKQLPTVSKTTERLNASVERCAFRYLRIGWLDRDYSGEPKFRRANNVDAPEGELWVYAPQEDQTSWRKIGELAGEQVNLTIASDAIPRGSIVFCRTPARETKKVARRNVEDAIFRR